jgi:transcriptional regulator with XRE-family HTH domain
MNVDGARVRSLRGQKVMERKELAQRSGISYSTLAEIERNARGVRAETVRAIARELGVEPEELVRSEVFERPQLRAV